MHRSQGRSIARHSLLSLQQIHRMYVLVRPRVFSVANRFGTSNPTLAEASPAHNSRLELGTYATCTYIEASSQTFACLDLRVAISHVTVWHSLSMSTFHFVNVAYATFFFYASGADSSPELDALFILTGVLEARLETSHLNHIC